MPAKMLIAAYTTRQSHCHHQHHHSSCDFTPAPTPAAASNAASAAVSVRCYQIQSTATFIARSEIDMDPTTPLAQPKRKKRNRPVRLEDIQLEWLGQLHGSRFRTHVSCRIPGLELWP